MSDFFISFKDLLEEYGVDIKVYPYDKPSSKPHYHYVGGIKVDDTLVDAESRHEPVLPNNAQNSLMAQFLSGGEMTQADLRWISSKKYPINTKVEVSSQGGTFRVVSCSDYQGYSDVVIYGLKGDDKHLDD